MAVNRGKQFENVVREAFEKVPEVSVDRLHDQTTGFKGSQNICDFIVYRKPYEFYFECKSVHGNTLSIYSNEPKKKYGNITNKQWDGLLEKSKIEGVFAGIICWWIDKGITLFIPIQVLQFIRSIDKKSVRYDDIYNYDGYPDIIEIKGQKKRVFFEYDMEEFLNGF